MKKKAIISITSSQIGEGTDPIEVVTPGEFYKENDEFIAVYNETELSGMEGTVTKLRVKDKLVTLEREGSIATKMEFEEENVTVSLYNTPYGVLELKITTTELDVNINENGGEANIAYEMSVGGQKPLNTELKLKIKA